MSRFVHAEVGGSAAYGGSPHRSQAGAASAKLMGVVVVLSVALGGAVSLGLLSGPSRPPTWPGAPPGTDRPPPAGPALSLAEPPRQPPVLIGVETSEPVSARRLRTLVAPQLRSSRHGPHLTYAVAALGARGLLDQEGGPRAVTPASTMKLLTTTAALSALGPGHRFATSVVRGVTSRRIVLVGGGDPLLTDARPTAAEAAAGYPQAATLQQLAVRTGDVLRRSGVHRVRLGYDDYLFSGPAVNPRWRPAYIPESVVSPTSALWVDEGRAVSGLLARVKNPALVAADRFALLLAKQGVEVGRPVAHLHAPRHAPILATVESAPLAQIVQHVLELSDNEAAEVLLRQLAIASGRPGSSQAGVRVVRSTLAGLGIDLKGAQLYDGSGLSRQDRLPVEELVDVIQLAAGQEHPELRTVVSSLPVAGFSGSLDDRFVDDAPAGLGVVRAKTGTLTGVHGLAGTVLTRAGQVLVFAALAERVPVPRILAARAQLDRIAATLSTCGC